MITTITPINGEIFVSGETVENYLKQFNAMRNYSNSRRITSWGEPDDASIEQIIDDFLHRQDLRQSTARTYSSAAIWILENTMVPCELSTQLLEAIRKKKIVRPKRSAKLAPRTISEVDIELILNQLSKSRKNAKWAPATKLWIKAGLAAGIRPCEWQHAKWLDHEGNVLRVINAKVKERVPTFKLPLKSDTVADNMGIDVGPKEYFCPEHHDWPEEEISKPLAVRHIWFLTAGEIESIQAHMDSIERHLSGISNMEERQSAFDEYHEQCSCALNRACKKIWSGKRPYCLYTFRGQFAANMKAYFGNEVTAELMGHSSAHSSSTSYYGHGSRAHKRFKGHRQSEFQVPTQRNRHRQCE